MPHLSFTTKGSSLNTSVLQGMFSLTFNLSNIWPFAGTGYDQPLYAHLHKKGHVCSILVFLVSHRISLSTSVTWPLSSSSQCVFVAFNPPPPFNSTCHSLSSDSQLHCDKFVTNDIPATFSLLSFFASSLSQSVTPRCKKKYHLSLWGFYYHLIKLI